LEDITHSRPVETWWLHTSDCKFSKLPHWFQTVELTQARLGQQLIRCRLFVIVPLPNFYITWPNTCELRMSWLKEFWLFNMIQL
jgi:hypothetical protein